MPGTRWELSPTCTRHSSLAVYVTVGRGLFFFPIELEIGVSVVGVFLFGRDVPRFVVVGHEAHIHGAVDDGVGVVEGLAAVS